MIKTKKRSLNFKVLLQQKNIIWFEFRFLVILDSCSVKDINCLWAGAPGQSRAFIELKLIRGNN